MCVCDRCHFIQTQMLKKFFSAADVVKNAKYGEVKLDKFQALIRTTNYSVFLIIKLKLLYEGRKFFVGGKI